MREQILVWYADELVGESIFFVKGDLGNRQRFTLLAAVLVKMLPSPDA